MGKTIIILEKQQKTTATTTKTQRNSIQDATIELEVNVPSYKRKYQEH